jgi:3-deoxy-D-manno-octulosonic-acid transferase
MIVLYFFLSSFFFAVLFPVLFILYKKEVLSRLGFHIPLKKNVIWFHAASVGEINAIKPLLIKMIEKFPERNVVLSVTSQTGRENAAKISPVIDVFIYPLDLFFIMYRIFAKMQPQCIILMETEWWPSMLYFAKKKKIPVVMINARLTDKSLRNYSKTKFFWKPLWKAISVIGAQSDENKRKFASLGFTNLLVTKNLKFHAAYPKFSNHLREKWRLSDKDFVVVWGSSRPGEEALFQSMLPELKARIPNLKAIVCPRHLNRLGEVQAIFPEPVTYSELNKNYDVLIIDKMGVLLEAYSLCDIAIVGGSFFDFGGHNPLEPAFYAKAILMGHYHSSCQESVELLINNKAIIISETNTLKKDIEKLYYERDKRLSLGFNAKQVMNVNCDSFEKNLQLILPYLEQ